jgi:DNA-binding NtrC family response regulator
MTEQIESTLAAALARLLAPEQLYTLADLIAAKTDAEMQAAPRVALDAGALMDALRTAATEAETGDAAGYWRGFSLAERVRRYEAGYIALALRRTGGSISRAARLLGFKHHASLASMLRRRHKQLATLRTPPTTRRRSMIKRRGAPR